MLVVEDGEAARLETASSESDVVRKEAQPLGEFRDGHQTARARRREHFGQDSIGVCQVVQRHRCPRDVDRVQVGPGFVQIRVDRTDPISETEGECLATHAVQHLLGRVDRDHLGAVEALREADRPDSGARAEIDDPLASARDGVTDGSQYVRPVRPQDLAVQVEQRSEVRVVVIVMVIGHGVHASSSVLKWHTILPMTQEPDLDAVIRARIRGLRLARGWSLDALAARCHMSPSTLSRIETGQRRISVDQLVPIARALDSTLDQLVESAEHDDVVIRPRRDRAHGVTSWLLSGGYGPQGMTVAKMRITARRPPRERGVHPGRDWFTVLSGTARLHLGDRIILVAAGQAAQFSTMTPHAITADGEPVEILVILDREGQRAHLDTVDLTANPG